MVTLCRILKTIGVSIPMKAPIFFKKKKLHYFATYACFICKQIPNWWCVRWTMASHNKCMAWLAKVIHLKDEPGKAVCWRHPADWRLDRKVNFFFPSLPLMSWLLTFWNIIPKEHHSINSMSYVHSLCWRSWFMYRLLCYPKPWSFPDLTNRSRRWLS